MNAERAWVRGVVALGGDESAAEAGARDLAGRYAQPHRRYHGRSHVEAVLTDAQRLASAESLDARQQAVLTLGVCAHDVVYDAMPGDDEQASADWARHQLASAGVDEEPADAVAALVMTTLTHSFPPEDRVAAVLSDADLAILAAERTTYDGYTRAVREEYAAVPDDLWVIGRRNVLEQLLAKPRLFVTDAGHDQWEASARENIERELEGLRPSE